MIRLIRLLISVALVVGFYCGIYATPSSAKDFPRSDAVAISCPPLWPRREYPGPPLWNVEIYLAYDAHQKPPEDGLFEFEGTSSVQMDCQYSRAQEDSRHVERRTVVIALPLTVTRCIQVRPPPGPLTYHRVCEVAANPDGTIGPIMQYVTEPVNYAVALWGVRIAMSRAEARAALVAQGIKPEDIADLGAEGLRVPLARGNGFLRIHIHPVRQTANEVAWHTPLPHEQAFQWAVKRFGLVSSSRPLASPQNTRWAYYWPSVTDPVEVEFRPEFEGEPQRIRLIDLSDLPPEERARRR